MDRGIREGEFFNGQRIPGYGQTRQMHPVEMDGIVPAIQAMKLTSVNNANDNNQSSHSKSLDFCGSLPTTRLRHVQPATSQRGLQPRVVKVVFSSIRLRNLQASAEQRVSAHPHSNGFTFIKPKESVFQRIVQRNFDAREAHLSKIHRPFNHDFDVLVTDMMKLVKENPPLTLLTLPPELTEMIIHAVDPRSLFAVRLTCRLLSGYAFEPFGRHFFRTRHHVLSIHSLSVLNTITANPVLGRLVRTIKLGSSRLSKREGLESTEHDRHFKTIINLQNNLTRSPLGPRLLARTLRNIHRHRSAVRWGIWDDADLLISSGFVERPPEGQPRPASNTADAGSTTEVRVWKDKPLGSTRRFTSPALPASVNKYFTIDSRPWAVLHLILGGMDLTPLNMRSLSVGIQNPCEPFLHSIEPLRNGLATLTHLSFNAQPASQRVDNIRNRNDLHTTVSFIHILAETPLLTSLVLRSSAILRYLGYKSYLSLHGNIGPRLKTLTLKDTTVTSERLCYFLEFFRQSLRTLVLIRVQVEDTSGLKPVLEFVQARMNLDEWTIEDLTGFEWPSSRNGIQGSTPISMGYKGKKYVVKGKELVKQSLLGLLAAFSTKPPKRDDDAGLNYWG